MAAIVARTLSCEDAVHQSGVGRARAEGLNSPSIPSMVPNSALWTTTWVSNLAAFYASMLGRRKEIERRGYGSLGLADVLCGVFPRSVAG